MSDRQKSMKRHRSEPVQPQLPIGQQALVHSFNVRVLSVLAKRRQSQQFSLLHELVVNFIFHLRSVLRGWLGVDSHFPSVINLSALSARGGGGGYVNKRHEMTCDQQGAFYA